MKIPANPNYGLMKLPYSNSTFPSHLTSNPVLPAYLFSVETLFPHDQSVYMLWPSSWNYPDGLLRDAFGILVCLPEQTYSTYVALSKNLKSDIEMRVLKKEKKITETMRTPKFFEILLQSSEDKLLTRTKTSFVMPYSFHKFLDFNEIMEVSYFFRHNTFTQQSQGPEVYCLRKEAFAQIKKKEYEFETRILQGFHYYPALYGDFLDIGCTNEVQNREQNLARTDEVEEREAKRVTPMKPRW